MTTRDKGMRCFNWSFEEGWLLIPASLEENCWSVNNKDGNRKAHLLFYCKEKMHYNYKLSISAQSNCLNETRIQVNKPLNCS